MITKYRAVTYGCKPIAIVQIDRETDSSIWIDGSRKSKISENEGYFDIYSDARDYLITKIVKKIRAIEFRLDNQKKLLNKIKTQHETDI